MRKVNYKSDFDFIIKLKDPRDNTKTVPFPECDFDSILWTSNKSTAYRFSCQNGKYVNCFLETDGGLHVVVNNHRLGKGMLRWEPHFKFPNGLYPDFIRDTNNLELLGIELVDWADSCPLNAVEVEATLPAVYLTAYDLAVRNGYTGTYEEYVQYTNRFPQVVESAETVNALLSDFADGKARIADALTRQGVDTASDESMQTMADKVLGLQLAVEGDPQYVEHDSRVGGYDLYNVMHNHRKAEFPYLYAVSFNAPTVTLSGADAYLCSDGYYTEESGSHKMPFAQEHYVIYYFRNRSFTLTATAARLINEMCVYNGAPIVNFGNPSVRRLFIYGDEPFSTNNVGAFTISGDIFTEVAIESLESGYATIRCSNAYSFRATNLKALKGGDLLYFSQNIMALSLPALETVSGGTVANTTYNLAELALPALTTVSGGTVAFSCNSLTELALPALESITGGTVVSNAAALAELALPALTTVSGGTVAFSCNSLTELALPALESITGGTVVSNAAALAELALPALESITGGKDIVICGDSEGVTLLSLPRVVSINYGYGRHTVRPFAGRTAEHVVVDLPICEQFCGGFHDVSRNGVICELRFGTAIQGIWTQYKAAGILVIKIGKGVVTSLDSANANWDAEALKQFIADLGDNTGGEVKQLRIGASQIAKLSDEDIALAVAKNYTLS